MSSDWITKRGVPIARVGDWPTYKGSGTLTRQDLADAVAASQDPLVRDALDGDPRGWLGHTEDQIAAATRQSEPCVGRVTNLRLDDTGDTLIGDVEDVPVAVTRMYPRRSVEMQPNVTGTGGRTYRRVLSGLAYLGHKRGAIKGLGDLTDLIDGRVPPVLAAQGETVLMALADDEPTDHGDPQDVLPPAQGDRTVDRDMPAVSDPQEPTVPDTSAPVEPEAPTASDDTKPVDPPAQPPEPEQPTTDPAPKPDGPQLVSVSKAVLDDITAKLEKALKFQRDTEQRQAVQERDVAIAAAEAEGRIAPKDRDDTVAYFAAHGTDAGLALLQRLPKGTAVPLGEIGHDAPDDQAAEFGADDTSHLTPDEAARLGYTTKG